MAAEIDQQFVEYIVKALVGNPDAVQINRTIDEKGVLLELTVDPQDLGRVIGRGGVTAKSIRTLLRALGVKNDARYNLKIVDTNEGGAPAPAAATDDTQAPTEEPSVEQPDEAPIEAEPEQPEEAEPEAEKPAEEEEDAVSRHREDIKDLTDLDI